MMPVIDAFVWHAVGTFRGWMALPMITVATEGIGINHLAVGV